jgi:phenylalanyl-tRNA synthetase alpha chain
MSGSNPINSNVVDPLVASALEGIAAAETLADLLESRSALVGENSEISKLNASIKNMPNEFKAEAGAILGAARGKLNAGSRCRDGGRNDLGKPCTGRR